MYEVSAYNKESYRYEFLDTVEARTKEQAIESWKRENPSKAKTLNHMEKIIIVALLDGGGI